MAHRYIGDYCNFLGDLDNNSGKLEGVTSFFSGDWNYVFLNGDTKKKTKPGSCNSC